MVGVDGWMDVSNRRKALLLVNSPQFKKMAELGDEFYEFELVKGNIVLDMPIYIGFRILQYAKLKMLEFYYDCIDLYIEREKFCYVTMDTDSAYISLAFPSLMDGVKHAKREEVISQIYNRCSDNENPKWFIRECCNKHKSFDSRLPGIMKEEANGNETIAPTSKTYILKDGDICKYSCKGVNKAHISSPF